jgi:hypothetical protein
MLRRAAAAAGIVLATLPFVATAAHAQTPAAEDELLALINTVRGNNPLVMHAGLREIARAHAAAMATAGSLNHRRAKARIDSAQPDPPQSGGPPDNGFTGTWCEVVGWEPSGADAGVARRFFDDWRETAQDNSCMTNEHMTVAGIGVYERGNRWWATLEMEDDTTPPKASAPATAAPSPAPHPSAAAATTPPSTPAPRDLAEARSTATSSSGLGWREIAVAVGGFMVVPVLHFLRRRRTARV